MKRRDFFRYAGAGALVTAVQPTITAASTIDGDAVQELHHDFRSDNPGNEYFITGNGHILAAIQSSPGERSGTHAGMLLMSSAHFGRKMSSFLFHPERGIQNSKFFLRIRDRAFSAQPGESRISWFRDEGIPMISIEWNAEGVEVHELMYCPINDPVVVRTIRVKNVGSAQQRVDGTILLYPNLMLFDEYAVDRVNMSLTALGYHRLQMFCDGRATVGDRHMQISFGEVKPGETAAVNVYLSVDQPREHVEVKGATQMKHETKEYWSKCATFDSSSDDLNKLFACAQTGIRAAVAKNGKMDGSIWQYNLEWVRDQSMVAIGSVMGGLPDVSTALINRMLEHSVDEEGGTVESSRYRPPETMELDQNGSLLYAIWMNTAWTGDDTIIREHWTKIKKVADYVLRPEFRDPAIGLLKNSREYWERDPGFGVKEGYEVTYQMWNILGLEKAAELALLMNDRASAKKWTEASRLMRKSFLSHPQLSQIEDGRFIKRRLPDGTVQRTFEPPNRGAMPPGMPLNVEKVSYCDPDASSSLPIVWGLVDPRSDVALNTLRSMEHLWNQRWDYGGYARYDVTSEPDSPGPWPFATMFITRAYHEAGDHEKVWRSLNWLLNIQGGNAGAWFEYYGQRPTPPLPPVGIVVWTWAELLMYFTHHMIGFRPGHNSLKVRPKHLDGIESLYGKMLVRGRTVTYNIHRTTDEPYAVVGGRRTGLVDGTIEMPFPTEDTGVEIFL